MRPDYIDDEIQKIIHEGDPEDYIPIHNGEDIIGVIPKISIEYHSTYGGAWIGKEKLRGFAKIGGKIWVIVNDGNYDYSGLSISEKIYKDFQQGKIFWNSIEMCFENSETEM